MPAVDNKYFAHPANARRGIPAQSYEEHVRGVVSIYEHNATQMLRYYSGKIPTDMMLSIGRDASLFHDLGKLLEDFQRFMQNGCKGPRINHVDSGVSFLMNVFRTSKKILEDKNQPVNYRFLLSAVIVQGHHIGLLNPKPDDPPILLYGSEVNDAKFLRDYRTLARAYPHIKDQAIRVMDYVDNRLAECQKIHISCVPEGKAKKDAGDPATWRVDVPSLSNYDNYDHMQFTGLDLRLLSSCVFFADHTDTARADGGIAVDEETPEFPLRATERIQQLDELYKKQFGHLTDKRAKVRQRVFDDASNLVINAEDNFFLLEAHVGSGKTLSGLKLALRLAETFKSRRLFCLAPFTTIIDQVSEVYNNKLILPDEKLTKDFDDTMVVAKHHHLTAYGKKSYNSYRNQLLKALAVNWFSPITVSSVEQFVNSFASNAVPLLKKLNKVPGSVIIIEEAHTIPISVWPWLLYILRQLVEKWHCKIVFVTGTPIKFWELPFVNEAFGNHKVKKVISPNTARSLSMHERQRVKFSLYNNGDFSPINPFVEQVCKTPGAKLVVCSTTQNAAVIAQLCANNVGYENVFHISTAITPNDRSKIIKKVTERLKEENRNFILVGTSCIESGVDFSFDTGFVEARSVTTSLQSSGRINRNFEREVADVVVFRLQSENVLTRLNSMAIEENVLIDMMRENPQLTKASVMESVKRAFQHRSSKIAQNGEAIVIAEKKFSLREVRKEVRCINEFGINAIVNPKLLELLNCANPYERYDVDGSLSLPLSIAREDLGLEPGKFVTNSWLQNQVQKHSFRISVADEETLHKRELPCLNLEEYWNIEESNEELDSGFERLTTGLYAWQGRYDPDFLGYMNHVLVRLQIPGVRYAPIPFDYVRGMFLE